MFWGLHSCEVPSFPGPTWSHLRARYLRGADALEAALVEYDGGIAAAAALIVVTLDIAGGCAAALAVRIIGPGAAAPVAVGVLCAGTVAELTVPLILVRAGEAGAVPFRGEDELAAQTGTQMRTASLPRTAWGTNAHSSLHDVCTIATWSPGLWSPPLLDSCCPFSSRGVPPSPREAFFGGCRKLAVYEAFTGDVPTSKHMGWLYIHLLDGICLCHNPCLPIISDQVE